MSAQQYFTRGTASYNSGNFQAAVNDFNQCIKLRGNKPTAEDYYYRAATLCELGNHQAAFDDIQRCFTLRNGKVSAMDYYWRGRIYYELKNYKLALVDLTQCIEARGGNPSPWEFYYRAATNYFLGNYQTALEDINWCIKFRNGKPSPWDFYWKGVANYNLGRYQAALDAFNECLRLRDRSPNAWDFYYRAATNCLLDNFQAALEDINYCIKLRNNNPLAWDYYWYGRINYESGYFQAALKGIDMCIKLRSGKPESGDYLWRGCIYQQLNEPALAQQDFRQGLQLPATLDYQYHARGRLYYELGEYEVALAELTKAIQQMKTPPFGRFYYWRAKTYYKLDNITEAINDCQQALSLENKQEFKDLIAVVTKHQQDQQQHGKLASLLVTAVQKNNISQMRGILAQHPNLDFKLPDTQKTILHVAAEANHLQATELLLDAGADMNSIDALGNTPLHYAANADVVNLLLRKGALREVKNQQGQTPVQVAMQHQQEDIAKLLLALPAKRQERGHAIVGDRYALINKITPSEAEELYQQTGLLLSFPPGKAKIRPIIAQGQFGKLRIARNISTNQFIGVKKIKGQEEIQASKEEGYLQWQLKDKLHLMPLLDTVEMMGSQGQPVLYQFMPLAALGNGEALSARLAGIADTNLKTRLLVRIAQQLLTGMSHMHAANIYHLDMKPANIVMDKNGVVFVVDFGCAKAFVSNSNNKKAVFRSVNGDTRYFAPERLADSRFAVGVRGPATEVVDGFDAAKADAWAVGVTLWELAKHVNPFAGTTVDEKLSKWDSSYYQAILNKLEELQSPSATSYWQVVKGLLAIDPDERLSVAEALDSPVFKRGVNQFEDEKAWLAALNTLKTAESLRAESLSLWNSHYGVTANYSNQTRSWK